MSNTIDWMIVKDRAGKKEIGAVGFLGDDPAVVVTFFDEKDWNMDGDISLRERASDWLFPLSMKGTVSLEVTARAYDQACLQIVDDLPGAAQKAKKLRHLEGQKFQAVAANMALDGIFAAYMAPKLTRLGSAIGAHIDAKMVKSVVINAGMKKAAKAAFDAAIKSM